MSALGLAKLHCLQTHQSLTMRNQNMVMRLQSQPVQTRFSVPVCKEIKLVKGYSAVLMFCSSEKESYETRCTAPDSSRGLLKPDQPAGIGNKMSIVSVRGARPSL